ncbi:Protein of unknown function [Selenomonas ruminantium]|uniref:DUF2993 domain-containing protein n=1 Tax=Selenomonas ruminantium TaxID=971 RepID=A0A1I3CR76_SELRU|nr:Protein of unknown function [Selenomonas ruminantium]
MRKGLTILGLLFIILIVSSATVLPWLAQSTIKTKLAQRAATDDVVVTVDSTPTALLAIGRIQQLDAVLHQAKVGQVFLRELTLKGRNVQLDMPALLSEQGIQVKKADELTLMGTVDEENLREVLQRRIDKIENIQVNINRDRVLVTANAKIFGRVADIEMEGQITENSGALFFLMTRLEMRNTLIGTAKLGDLFGNIQLAAADKLPLGMKIRQVEQTDGAVIITAARDNKE